MSATFPNKDQKAMIKIIHVTQEMIDNYGKLNGDNDIIHYDIEYARKRGYKDTLAHGPMVMGYVAEMAARKYGAEWHRRGQIKVKFVAPTYPNEDLVLSIDDEGNVEASAGGVVNVVGTATLF
jgi:3-hydroxybutyryl-CoA dehydratase